MLIITSVIEETKIIIIVSKVMMVIRMLLPSNTMEKIMSAKSTPL